ncbi:hypothetical protein VaNZ11_005076, partial [Volvox africanus]
CPFLPPCRSRRGQTRNGYSAFIGSSSSTERIGRLGVCHSSSDGHGSSRTGFGACWACSCPVLSGPSSSSVRSFAAGTFSGGSSAASGSSSGSRAASGSSGSSSSKRAGAAAGSTASGCSAHHDGVGGDPLLLGLIMTGNHYEVLGVPRDASLATIKRAFRQRAKELHPDVLIARAKARHQQHPHDRLPYTYDKRHSYDNTVEQSAAAFLRIVAAYEALSTPTRRRAYDMQLAAETAAAATAASGYRRGTDPKPAGAAAAQQQQQRASRDGRAAASGSGSGSGIGNTDLRHVDFRSWRYGIDEWMSRARREPVEGRTATLDYYLRKYSHEFESHLHAALVHAYLGPKLDLQPGELPRCFEADVRRHPGASDQLMQLVSGRTLLGVVRVKEPLRLESAAAAAAAAASMLPSAPSSQPPPPPFRSIRSEDMLSTIEGCEAEAEAEAGVEVEAKVEVRKGLRVESTAAAAGVVTAASAAADSIRTSGGLVDGYSGCSDGDGEGGDVDPYPPASTSSSSSSTAATAVAAVSLAGIYGNGGSDKKGGADPLDVLGAAGVRGLSDADVVHLAAASIARNDADAAGYGHLVPGYSRLRGLLECQGFYPDAAVLQRRSMQISLVTAAEAAQARNGTAALGGRRLMDGWRRDAAAAVHAGPIAAVGGREEQVLAEVTPPPQLQDLAEATRLAGAEVAAAATADEAATAAAAAACRKPPSPPFPPLNSPRRWRFGPDHEHGANSHDVGVVGGGGATKILEMWLGQNLTSFAVHQLPLSPSPPLQPSPSALGNSTASTKGKALDLVDPRVTNTTKTAPGDGASHPEGLMVPIFGPVIEGRIKVYINGHLEAGVEGCHVYDTEGRRVALVVRGSFPGLRTIHFFSIHAAPDTTQRPRLRLLCRCVRARLLPSPTWLFPPREATHDVGGWYFEWGGYNRRGQPGWLDPSVFVFVAATVASEQERIEARHQRVVSELLQGWWQAAWQALAGWWERAGWTPHEERKQ